MTGRRPVAVVGPTATGKSALAVELAEVLGGEVVNADAMQLYRGMDIGTAKLTEAERRAVPHHLLDVLDVTDTASVAAYQRQARIVIDGVRAGGGVPVLAGGSGLYVRAALDDLRFPGTEAAVRTRLEAELAEVGVAELHRRLVVLDPAAAQAVLPGDDRRIVRALEVIEITGGPFTSRLPAPGRAYGGALLLGLDCPVEVLDARIAVRVRRMFDTGLVEEVVELARRGLREGRTASRALGYRQVLAALDGTGDLPAAEQETVRATRRLVRRQRSWFRRDPRVHWLDATDPGLLRSALGIVRGRP